MFGRLFQALLGESNQKQKQETFRIALKEAMQDGVITNSELTELEALAVKLGIPDDELTGVRQFVQKENPEPSKNTDTSKEQLVVTEMVSFQPSDYTLDDCIVIEFPFSTAQSYDFAVIAAEKILSYSSEGDGKKKIHRVTLYRSTIEQARDLLEHLKGWRKRIVYVNGERKTWDSVFGFSWCFERRQSSFEPHKYCFGIEGQGFNIWGCTQADLSFEIYSNLWCMGSWSRDGIWTFNKDQIRHHLAQSSHPVRFCPALNIDRIQKAIDALPNKVNPKVDTNWTYVESYGMDMRPSLEVRVGFNSVLDRTFKAIGVRPANKAVINDIARKLSNSF